MFAGAAVVVATTAAALFSAPVAGANVVTTTSGNDEVPINQLCKYRVTATNCPSAALRLAK